MKIKVEEAIKVIDFWHSSLFKEKLIPRSLLTKIDLNSKEIVDIIGPRRSGKSSLLKLLLSQLKVKDNFLYLNFEDPFFVENNNSLVIEELIATAREYFSPNLKYLFFDEIQAVNNWERAVRKLRDGNDFKIFLTGSSSRLLSREISSLLTGRHLSYQIFPLSFAEFLQFNKISFSRPKEIVLRENLLKKYFQNYFQIGGFPEVVLTGKPELLKNYFYDFLQKDIFARYDVRDKSTLEKMAIFLLSNSAKIISLESIKSVFALSYETAQAYLSYLKEAFLVLDLTQFSFSLKRQSRALKKIYAVDVGLAQTAAFRFSADRGRILENIIFLHLHQYFEKIYYYKTKNNLEVDFIVFDQKQKPALIQVCWQISDEATKKREIKALAEAMVELKIKEGIIITNEEEEEINQRGLLIRVKPAWKWLLELES